jgi:hypothetical protein
MVMVRGWPDALDSRIALQEAFQSILNKQSDRVEQDKKNGAEYRETWVCCLKLSSAP